MTKINIKKCQDCLNFFDENAGRLLITQQVTSQTPGNSLKWRFLCLNCIRDWRRRGLKREGLEEEEILRILDIEFPLTPKD